ncbi:4-(cytidine 5'-diphospho)-2-C-methyl-D-erythritol kinase [Caldimonas sp. KR1-144]|uniref:4-(cytidine 5'-diphospho)-2-C-methyl-D-erythritol kinase n=1 Tax=Caldimonas sp. KR1-144 TaxID=3400911 RepID=UPI003C057AE3
MRSITDLPAPAKLNLFLHVVGKRADGYHLLQSVFALIDWADTLHVERRDDGRLARHDLGLALPPDDLTLRAARALQAASGTTLGADLSIDKRVPWGAGLGGGSSDAATALLALNRLWGLGWPRSRLAELAATLGADVPFFVGGRNAWVEGVGEKLTPIEFAPRWWAVLKPAVAIPTVAVFTSPALAEQLVRARAPAILSDFLADPTGFGRNDLQLPAMAYSSEVGQALKLLEARFGASRMSGSGSAVFAEVGAGESPRAAMLEADELPAGWVGRMCRGLERHPLADWAGD